MPGSRFPSRKVLVAKGVRMSDTGTDEERKRMRSKRVIMVSVLMASLLFPLALGVEAAGPTNPPEAISEEEARQFIDKYVDRYKAMDIDLFKEFFSKKSIENRSVLYP